MAHSHPHSNDISGRRLFLTVALNFLIAIAEIIGGLIAGSLSLLADALHNFSDGIAVIISYIALRLSHARNSQKHTFGLKRAEILAAVINSSVLLGLSFYLFYESIQRLLHPSGVNGLWMAAVGSIGLVANVIGTWLLQKGAAHNLNIRSAYLHLLADAASSVAVVAGGFAIHFWGISWIDPALTIVIGVYVLRESFLILAQATHILMEGTPAGIDLEALRKAIETLHRVKDVHHIHVWSVAEHDIHLEAHVGVGEMPLSGSDSIRKDIEELLKTSFGINHVTLQMECNECRDVGLIKN